MLRPDTLDEIIGNQREIECIKLTLGATSKRNEPFPHTLLKGYSGCGKTTIARAIAHEKRTELIEVNGAALKKPKILLPTLAKINKNTTIFCDEIHRVDIKCQEYLYTIMEDWKLNLGRGHTMNFEPFTLIGATTESGMMSEPFRNRFKLNFTLNFYKIEGVVQILKINSKKLNLQLREHILKAIARRSRGIPRIANSHLEWIRNYITERGIREVKIKDIDEAFAMLKIDRKGLTVDDRRYIRFLLKNAPAGADTISASLNISKEVIEKDIEPFLLRKGLITKTRNGREYIGEIPKKYEHLVHDDNSLSAIVESLKLSENDIDFGGLE